VDKIVRLEGELVEEVGRLVVSNECDLGEMVEGMRRVSRISRDLEGMYREVEKRVYESIE